MEKTVVKYEFIIQRVYGICIQHLQRQNSKDSYKHGTPAPIRQHTKAR